MWRGLGGTKSARLPWPFPGSEAWLLSVALPQQPGGVAGAFLCKRGLAPPPGSQQGPCACLSREPWLSPAAVQSVSVSDIIVCPSEPLKEKEPSVHGAIVGFVKFVEGEIHCVCGDGLSVQRV